MKIIVHDYSGHPFQVQLSRNLALRGHEVTHLYYPHQPGPKGRLDRQPDDPATLTITGVALKAVSQTALIARFFNEAAYGRAVAAIIRTTHPDVVLSANAPPGAQHHIIHACKANGIRFVYWLQDVWSVAITTFLSQQLGLPGKAIGAYYRRLDREHFRRSDAIVAITEDFLPLIKDWGGDPATVTVIENWGALDDIPVRPKDNPWSRLHGLHDKFAYLYAGTLGRKHNPELLALLAADTTCGVVAVAAQGVSVPFLQEARLKGTSALKLMPLQPAEDFADMLGAADVLVAMIESEAGMFAVPSKVLSYMCAGRPILLAAPAENLAARTVRRAQCGLVVEPSDPMGFVDAAVRLRNDSALRARLGANGRAYAERAFDIAGIADRFEAVLGGPQAGIPAEPAKQVAHATA